MAINVLDKSAVKFIHADVGYMRQTLRCQFNNNDTSGTLTTSFFHVHRYSLDVVGSSTSQGTVTLSVGASAPLTASNTLTLISPVSGTLANVQLTGVNSIANSNTGYWGFQVVDQTKAQTMVDGVNIAGNTTKTTGGGTLSAGTVLTLINSTVSGNTAISAGDVIYVEAIDTSSAPTINGFSAMMVINTASAGGGIDQPFIDNATAMSTTTGIMYLPNQTLTVSRLGTCNTANLQFNLILEGVEA